LRFLILAARPGARRLHSGAIPDGNKKGKPEAVPETGDIRNGTALAPGRPR
jgi:hypothetical protein